MTKEDILRMAREAGFDTYNESIYVWARQETITKELTALAALVATAEREACAKVCDDWPNGRDDVYSIGVAIRARGESK